MKFLLSLCLACISCHMIAQDNMVTVLKTFAEQPPLTKDVDKIVQTTYALYGTENPDTTITIDGTSTDFFKIQTLITEFNSPLSTIAKQFDGDDNLGSKISTKYNDLGLMTNQEVHFENSQTAALMNSSKTMEYDDQGRMISVSENGKRLIQISYQKDLVIDQMSMDLGMMIGNAQYKKIGDTIRYEMEMEFGEDFKAMMGGKEMPKERTDLIIKDNIYHYVSYKENDSGIQEIESETKCDKNLNILEQKFKDFQGENHIKYITDKKGRTIARLNVKTNEKVDYKYDQAGKLLHGYKNGNEFYFTYDETGNKLTEIQMQYGEPSALITYAYSYK